MAREAAVRARGVSKHYKLGAVGHEMVLTDFMDMWRRFKANYITGQELGDPLAEELAAEEEAKGGAGGSLFKALDGVSFDLYPGEAMGIIGANGAGKSTLLKLVSRVTLPTKGRILIRGRVLSMLEVGTGFHPELTGRENIYMNGLILGMSRREIDEKFDDIVDFSEIPRFINTPVKRYSSGMHIRLAFSVAAHFVPEVIVVDEVLSVGDASFQQKCLDKMEDILRQGRAILFVSHNMATISSFCGKGLWLDKGKIKYSGTADDAIMKYEKSINSERDIYKTELSSESENRTIGDHMVQLVSAGFLDDEGNTASSFNINMPVTVRVQYKVAEKTPNIIVPFIQFNRLDGSAAFSCTPPNEKPVDAGVYTVDLTIPGNFLNDGAYTLDISVYSHLEDSFHVHFSEYRALTLRINDPFEDMELFRYSNMGSIAGGVRPVVPLSWKVEKNVP